MANFERGFCSIEEYTAHESSRLNEASLSVDGLYTVMFSLQSASAHEAAKLPAKIDDIDAQDMGYYLVKFTILNPPKNPDLKMESYFAEGYMQSDPRVKVRVGGNYVKTGYFKELGVCGGPEQEVQDLVSASYDIEVPAPSTPVLVPV